jgi:hypothetical protein
MANSLYQPGKSLNASKSRSNWFDNSPDPATKKGMGFELIPFFRLWAKKPTVIEFHKLSPF